MSLVHPSSQDSSTLVGPLHAGRRGRATGTKRLVINVEESCNDGCTRRIGLDPCQGNPRCLGKGYLVLNHY